MAKVDPVARPFVTGSVVFALYRASTDLAHGFGHGIGRGLGAFARIGRAFECSGVRLWRSDLYRGQLAVDSGGVAIAQLDGQHGMANHSFGDREPGDGGGG